MKKIDVKVCLSEEDEQIMFDDEGNVDLTLKGLLFMNQLVGASFVKPDKLYLEGEYKENPYIIRNTDGSVLEVICETIAISFYNKKTITASATVRLNSEVYFTNDLVREIAHDVKAGSIGLKDTLKQEGNFLIRSINEQLDLKASLIHPGISRAIEKYSNCLTYGERMAQSMSQRNALKKLPQFNNPIKVTGVEGSRIGEVMVPYYYENEKQKDVEDIFAIAKSINAQVITKNIVADNGDTVIEEKKLEQKVQGKTIETSRNQEQVYKAERRQLAARYNKIGSSIVDEAKRRLYPSLSSLEELSNSQINILLSYAEKVIIPSKRRA